tara:strand:- start:295 stop:804 length:510 start_codon:yes stop_codon:yes gene_type:complete
MEEKKLTVQIKVMKTNLLYIFIAIFCLISFDSLSQSDKPLADYKLEKRAQKLNKQLRCLVCQNQSIDDSSAPLAKQLRQIVRERISAGDNDTEVKKFLVERYGDWILLKTPFKFSTVFLWFGPLIIILILLFFGYKKITKNSTTKQNLSTSKLSMEEKEKLKSIFTEKE